MGKRRNGLEPTEGQKRSTNESSTDQSERESALTIVRSIPRVVEALGDEQQDPDEKRRNLQAAFANKNFRVLLRFATDLISSTTIADVLTRTLDIAFEALPVHRGFILLGDPEGELRCEIARVHSHVEHRPQAAVPISRTMLHRVVTERVALLTEDALEDQRLSGTDSILQHSIRAAMCVPLWSGDRIIGFMQVDSPRWVRSLQGEDLDFLIALANFAAVAVQRLREQHARTRLQRYHAPALVDQALNPDSPIAGMQALKRAEVTVLFADMAGFTPMMENADPQDVADLLGIFFTKSAEVIFAERGTLDKFLGDGLMAFFGAPMPEPQHAVHAIRAAVRIQEAMDDWNVARAAQGLPLLHVHIGINSGPVVVGDIGSEWRADYTVLGSTVNIAARLEATVAQPGEIVVGEPTRQLAGEEFDFEPLGETALRGLVQPIRAHRVRRQRVTDARSNE